MAGEKFSRVVCKNCEQPLEAPSSMIGETIDCPSCGSAVKLSIIIEAPVKKTVAPPPPVSSSPVFDTDCPFCHSSNTMRCEMVLKSGSSKGTFAGLSLGGDGDVGTFGGGTSNQTLLAKTVEPPKEPSIGCAWLFMIPGGFLLLSGMAAMTGKEPWIGFIVLLFGLFFTVLPLKASQQLHDKDKPRYQKELADWKKSWLCLRCGKKYIPTTQ